MRGIANKEKRKAILEANRSIADILILQETHSDQKTEKIWEQEWGGDTIFNHGATNSRGIAIFLQKGMKKAITNIYKCEEGRTIIMDLQENGQKITIAAIYAPNQHEPKYFQKIRNELKERGENKIIIGDFNLTLDIERDRKNTYCNNNKAKEEIEDIMEEYILKDTWRIQNPDKREYSWFKTGEITKASRLDFALISAGIDQKVKSSKFVSLMNSELEQTIQAAHYKKKSH